MDSLIRLLRTHYRPKGCKDTECTHTSMNPKIGMHFSADKEAKLQRKIVEANREVRRTLRKGRKAERHCVVERPKKGLDACSIFRIEMDFKQPKWLNMRQYSSIHIERLAEIIWEVLDNHIGVRKRHKQLFLFEKDRPTLKKGDPDKDKADQWSDGFKFMAPFVHIPNRLFYVAFHEMRELARERGLFDNLILENKLEDVFDIGVIENSGWTMYGGCKPTSLPYNLKRIYGYDLKPIDAEYNPDDLVELLSIRRSKRKDRAEYKDDVDNGLLDEKLAKYEENKVRASKHKIKQNALNHMIDAKQKEENEEKQTLSVSGMTMEDKQNVEKAQKLVAMFTVDRATNYLEWMRVGWALHNIHPSTLPIWIEFSKRAKNFKKGECEKLWAKMAPNGFHIASLEIWASKDDNSKFKAFKTSQIHNALYAGITGNNHSIATVLKYMYGPLYVSACATKDNWYVFDTVSGHYKRDTGRSLANKIATDLVDEYIRLAAYYNTEAVGKSGLERDQLLVQAKKIGDLIVKLGSTKFINDTIAIARGAGMFYKENFQGELDSNPDMLGMEGGVYDLKNGVFREGVPEDYVSMSTGHKFIPYDENDPGIKWCYNFMKQLLPNPRVREYMWMLLASALDGHVHDEKFHLGSGKGSNGKTKLMSLLRKALGQYSTSVEPTLFTKKPTSAEGASPALAGLRGKRLVFSCEAEDDDKFAMSMVKRLSGGDEISARNLYESEFYKFILGAKFIFMVNKKPHVKANDDATWRRLRDINFGSRFCDKPDPKKKNEFKIDKHLERYLKDYAPSMLSILIHKYEDYKRAGGLNDIPEIMSNTKEYRNESDTLGEFAKETLEKGKKKKDTVINLYGLYAKWLNSAYSAAPKPNKKEFETYLKDEFNCTIKGGTVYGVGLRDDDPMATDMDMDMVAGA